MHITADLVRQKDGYMLRRVEVMDEDMFGLSLEVNSDYAWAQNLQKELKK